MRLSELIAKLEAMADEQGDVLILLGADGGRVYPREIKICMEESGGGKWIAVIR